MLEKCIQKAKDSGCKRVVLNVDKGKNKFSLTKWYKKLGFKVMDEKKCEVFKENFGRSGVALLEFHL